MTFITNKDYFHEVSSGRVAGSTADILTGFSFAAIPDVVYDITDVAADVPRPSVAETMTVVSSSTADDDGNTGMRTIVLRGLDVNFVEVTELITLDGTSSVVGAVSFIRIHEIIGITAGSLLTNDGIIVIQGTDTSDVYGTILPGISVARIATRTIPAGKTGRVLGSTWDVTRQSGGAMPKIAVVALLKTTGTPNSPWINAFNTTIDSSVANVTSIEGPTGITLPEKTDLRFTWQPDTKNVIINFRSWLVLEDA